MGVPRYSFRLQRAHTRYVAPASRTRCVCLLKQDKCVILLPHFVRLIINVICVLMGAAASVTSDRSDDKITVRTTDDVCDTGFGTMACPSPKGGDSNPLNSLSSPTGLFDAEIPAGTIPGQLFDISIEGKKFSVRCPPGKLPGDLISFAVGVAGMSFRKVLTGKQKKQLVIVE
jgi:hypothetical protein